mgnify:CR=1 FL=1
MYKRLLSKEVIEHFKYVSNAQSNALFNPYERVYSDASKIVQKKILEWFSDLFNLEFEPSISDYNIRLEPSEAGFLLNADISVFTSEFHLDWLYSLHGARSFESFVENSDGGQRLFKRLIKLLGYSMRDWQDEDFNSPSDLFINHGFGIEYSYDQNELPFNISCNQEDWRMPKNLAEKMVREVSSAIEDIESLYQLKAFSIDNYNGNFHSGLEFSYLLIPSF